MNILQINTTDNRGGAAKVAYNLKKGLEKLGHQTSMVVGRKYSSDSSVHILNDIQSFSGKIRRKLSYWLANDIDVFSSDHILQTKEFKAADIVHCHNLHSNYFNLNTLQKMAKLKPVVWTFHDMWPITAHCAHAFHGGLRNGFFQCPNLEIYPPIAWHNENYLERRKKAIYKNSNFHIVVPSDWLKEKVQQSVLKDKLISLIYNGIDTATFKPYPKEEFRKELNLPLEKKIVLSVVKRGQSNPWKGADYVNETIKSFRGNKSVLFVCVGGNTEGLSDQIKNIPYISNQEILAKYYSAADALLYPSIADNCPLVVLEAQACGLLVVAFKTGGIPELVEHGKTGYIARYKDADDLKTGLEYLLNLPPQEIEKMKQYSVNKIRTGFTVEKMADQYLNLYKKRLKTSTSLSDLRRH